MPILDEDELKELGMHALVFILGEEWKRMGEATGAIASLSSPF